MTRVARQIAPDATRKDLFGDAATPLDAMLDLAENAIQTVVDHGGETALRARLERLLPVPRIAAGSPQASRDAPPRLEPLEMAQLLTCCVQLGRFKLSGDVHGIIAKLRAWLHGEIRAANAARAGQSTEGGDPCTT